MTGLVAPAHVLLLEVYATMDFIADGELAPRYTGPVLARVMQQLGTAAARTALPALRDKIGEIAGALAIFRKSIANGNLDDAREICGRLYPLIHEVETTRWSIFHGAREVTVEVVA